MKKVIFVFMLLILPLASGSLSTDADLKVVATTSIVGDWVENVAGDAVDLDVIMGIGVDPHEYQPTAADTQLLQDADLVIFLGEIEEGLEATLEQLEEDGIAVSLFESIPEDKLLNATEEHDEDHLTLNAEDHGDYDPHFWHDPMLVKIAVETIRDALKDKDASNAASYDANAATYLAELDDLDAAIKTDVAKIDESKRFLVTQHAAFNYFAHQYGFEARSLQGLSTVDQAGLDEIEETADFLIEHEIEVIFLEEESPSDEIQAVIDEARSKDWDVVVGGTLLAGSLDEGDASTYIKLLESNANTIVQAILSPPENTDVPFDMGFAVISLFFMSLVALVRKERR